MIVFLLTSLYTYIYYCREVFLIPKNNRLKIMSTIKLNKYFANGTSCIIRVHTILFPVKDTDPKKITAVCYTGPI